ncbi:MAG: thymidine phosphorylase [Actinomycetaceae bacterium]|nr:thymidine phosphorylase [Actinomycetaceae bacterium]
MVAGFAAVDIIREKRDGQTLTEDEIRWIIDAYTRRQVGEEQMSALLMAIFFQGMNMQEISWWTDAMIRSGERLDFSKLSRPTVDKHSTGGVGDKITLPLAPLVASFGVAVPQLSGRGLGHTGGTLDKLEAIPGWRAALENDEMMAMLEDPGCVICAATGSLAPADKFLYALRDVTATVDSIPMISASIMSKKIAEGTSSLVLDVKFGSGAFMKTQELAHELAQTMVQLGRAAGVKMSALITDMNRPLGRKIGNALEVEESLEVLAGGGPRDVVELTVELAREMLTLAGQPDADVEAALKDGRAMDTWRQMIARQGGDVDAPLPRALHTEDVVATEDGYLSDLDALAFGVASWRLGAGRARKEDPVQAGAGIEIHVDAGSAVKRGDKLFTLHTDTPERFDLAKQTLADGYKVLAAAPLDANRSVVADRIK